MWHTQSGDRVLDGAEATLVKEAASKLAELLTEEASGFAEQWEYGIPLFDSLSLTQRFALLEHVLTHLFDTKSDPPPLTGVAESAVGAIFAQLECEVDFEIDEPDLGSEWRTKILNACRELELAGAPDDASDEPLPTPASTDRTEWGIVIESLMDEILWDRDYLLEDKFLDAPPEHGERLKTFMGIDEDYFSSAPPDVDPNDELSTVAARIGYLCSSEGSL